MQIDSFRPDLEVPDLEVQRVDLQEIPAWESVFDGEGSQVAEEQPRSAQQFPDWLSGQEVSHCKGPTSCTGCVKLRSTPIASLWEQQVYPSY